MPKAVQQKKGPLSNLIDMDPDKLPLNKLGEEQELAKGEQQKVQNLDNRSKKGALKQADMEEVCPFCPVVKILFAFFFQSRFNFIFII